MKQHKSVRNDRVRVTFCWSAISGYMAACWKALARRPEIDLHVIAHDGSDNQFSARVLEGLSYRLLAPAERENSTLITRLIADQQPDVVAMTGWWLPAYRRQVKARSLRNCRFIMGVDSPWRHEGQFLTRLRYFSTLSHIDSFFVAGERAWQYVRRLGVAPEKIFRGMYGIDTDALGKVAEVRAKNPWPHQFLFLGRYAPEKAIDVLVRGYEQYRATVEKPWDLVCCGCGPLSAMLSGRAGIQDRGFVHPESLPDVIANAGAFVLPSRFDPWPLALVEAAAAGLPVICTDACGSAVEVVRPLYNGLIVPAESASSLADAMNAVASRPLDLPLWGVRSRELAAPYSCELWADRWLDQIRRLV